MNNLIQKYVLKLCITLLFISQSASAAPVPGDPECKQGAYAIGFFNGVWNTRKEAILGGYALGKTTIRLRFDNEDVEYYLFYNHTGGLEDIAEVFQQRSLELDGALSNRWEIFWETLASSTGEGSFFDSTATKISHISNDFDSLIEAIYTDYITKKAERWADLLSNPPTINDIENQRKTLTLLHLAHKKIVLVAHSQGNLFLNSAYDYIMNTYQRHGSDSNGSPFITFPSIGVVHIAPASPTLRGPHILADLDLVINGLRAQGISTVPDITAEIPSEHLIFDDLSGHKLIATYLDSRIEPFPQVKAHMENELRQEKKDADHNEKYCSWFD